MKIYDNRTEQQLQDLVGEYGLTQILQALSNVCEYKAAMIELHENNMERANMWGKASDRIHKLAMMPSMMKLDD